MKTTEGTCPIREDSQTLSWPNKVVYELGSTCRIFCPLVVPVWSVPEQSRFCNVNVKKPEVSTFNWDGLMIRTITPQFAVRRPHRSRRKENSVCNSETSAGVADAEAVFAQVEAQEEKK